MEPVRTKLPKPTASQSVTAASHKILASPSGPEME